MSLPTENLSNLSSILVVVPYLGSYHQYGSYPRRLGILGLQVKGQGEGVHFLVTIFQHSDFPSLRRDKGGTAILLILSNDLHLLTAIVREEALRVHGHRPDLAGAASDLNPE